MFFSVAVEMQILPEAVGWQPVGISGIRSVPPNFCLSANAFRDDAGNPPNHMLHASNAVAFCSNGRVNEPKRCMRCTHVVALSTESGCCGSGQAPLTSLRSSQHRLCASALLCLHTLHNDSDITSLWAANQRMRNYTVFRHADPIVPEKHAVPPQASYDNILLFASLSAKLRFPMNLHLPMQKSFIRNLRGTTKQMHYNCSGGLPLRLRQLLWSATFFILDFSDWDPGFHFFGVVLVSPLGTF